MFIVDAVVKALELGAFMLWEVLWPLALGFLLSAVIQTTVSKRAIADALGRRNLRGLTLATLFGAASSSCSYAAVSVGRALFRRGADFVNAIAFEFASTNLVFELGLVLLVLLGWQFLAAEAAGGLLMIALLAVIFKYTLRARLVDEARAQADRGVVGRMEGHGAMDMSITDGPFLRRLVSGRALTAISHYFYMDLWSIGADIGIGFLIAGALGAWVPARFWQTLFLTGNPTANELLSPLIGPIVSMLSFVCSVGNVPLAAVLWSGGISFGGVVSFVFADLIILPIIDIRRKYYGGRMALYLLVASYVAMAVAGLVIGAVFQALGLAPAHRNVTALHVTVPGWDYTTVLDLLTLVLLALLGWRFLTTGGPAMLRAMDAPPDEEAVIDPVCGMTVDPASSEHLEHAGRTYYFCSSGCKDAFAANPLNYLHSHR